MSAGPSLSAAGASSSAETAGGLSATFEPPAPFPIASETDLPPAGLRAVSRQVDHLPAGTRRELAQRIRFIRRENIDWPAYYASRAMFWWTLAGFGFLFVGGMAGISQPGFYALGTVYLIFASIFLAAFILNVPRLNRQEALYEKWRADCEGLRAIRAALAEGDTGPALGEAA